MTRDIVSLLHGSVSLTRSVCESWSCLSHSVTQLIFAHRVGDAAKNAYHSNPETTVFDAKRLIGRKVDDPEIERDKKHWPFQIVKKNDKPAIEVRYKGENRQFVSFLAFVFGADVDVPCRLRRRSLPWFWAR